MKKSILFILCILFSCRLISYAQMPDIQKLSLFQKKHVQSLFNLLNTPTNTAIAMKSTGLKERVIAKIDYDYWASNYKRDSFIIKYSGGRGSMFDYNRMDYQFYAMGFNTYFGMYLPQGNPFLQSDTTLYYEQGFATTDQYLEEKISNKYDLNDNDTSILNYDFFAADTAVYKNVYNTSHNIIAQYGLIKPLTTAVGIIDSNTRQFFTYNAANQLIADSTYTLTGGAWALSLIDHYSYDINGNPTLLDTYVYDSSKWIELVKFVNTFNSDHQLLNQLTYVNTRSGFTIGIIDSFTYTPGVHFPVTWREYASNLSGTAFTTNFYYSKVLNTAGLPEAVYKYTWNPTHGFVLSYLSVVSYNKYNDPDSIITYVDTSGTPSKTPYSASYYYYETYTPSNITETPLPVAAQITIYPNPSKNILFINAGDLQTTSLAVKIMNVNGQVVKAANFPTGRHTNEISLTDISPGAYFISIQDETGKRLFSQTFIKE